MTVTVQAAFAAVTPAHARIGLDNALERATVLESRRISNGVPNENPTWPVRNVTRRDTYQTWQPTTGGPKINAIWSTPQTVDYLAIARHNIGSGGLAQCSLFVTPAGGSTTTYADDFSTDTDLANWTRGLNSVDGAFTITNGVLRYTKGAGDSDRPRIVRAVTTVAGTRYRLRCTAPTGTAAFKQVFVSTASNGSDVNALTIPTSNQSVDVHFIAPGTTVYVVLRENGTGTSAGFTAEVSEISITTGVALVATFTPSHDGPILIPFAPTSIEHAEIRFGDGAPLNLAVAALGKAVVMPRPLRATMQPVWLSRQTRVVPQETEGGNLLGAIVVRNGVTVSPEWSGLPLSFYNGDGRALARDLPGKAFFLAWQPAEHPGEVVYGHVTGDARGGHIRNSTRYGFGFGMTGQAPL
jgi:hypothetical protein